MIYSDDLLLIAKPREEGKLALNMALAFLMNLGFLVNFQKSALDPAQTVELLDHLIESFTLTIFLPNVKLEMTKLLCRKALNCSCRGKPTTLKELVLLVEKLNSCGEAVSQARFHWNSVCRDYQRAHVGGWKFSRTFHLSKDSKQELQALIDYLRVWNCRVILHLQVADRVTVSYESDTGWRGWIVSGPENASGSESNPMTETAGF